MSDGLGTRRYFGEEMLPDICFTLAVLSVLGGFAGCLISIARDGLIVFVGSLLAAAGFVLTGTALAMLRDIAHDTKEMRDSIVGPRPAGSKWRSQLESP